MYNEDTLSETVRAKEQVRNFVLKFKADSFDGISKYSYSRSTIYFIDKK